MALPREGREVNNYNGLRNGLGKRSRIDLQGVSVWPPKP